MSRLFYRRCSEGGKSLSITEHGVMKGVDMITIGLRRAIYSSKLTLKGYGQAGKQRIPLHEPAMCVALRCL